MPTAIVHLGLHKTATTYLQNHIWPQVKSHTYLTRPYTQHNHAFNMMQYADDTLYDPSVLARELESIGASSYLISDESLSGKPLGFSYVNRSQIARRLDQAFDRVVAILFLRDQPGIMASHYSSYLKMPFGVRRFEDVFWHSTRGMAYEKDQSFKPGLDFGELYYNTNDYFFNLDAFKYAGMVELYQELFDELHVFLYEDFVKSQTDMVQTLSEIIGEPLEVASRERSNKTLTPSGMHSTRITNRLFRGIENPRLHKALSMTVGPFILGSMGDLKPKAEAMARGVFTEDNRRLKQLLPDLAWDRHPGKYI